MKKRKKNKVIGHFDLVRLRSPQVAQCPEPVEGLASYRVSELTGCRVNGLSGYRVFQLYRITHKLANRQTTKVNPLNRRTRKPANRLTNKAFTIVELLIASSIFAVISVAVYTTFSLGMKVWHKAEKLSNEESRVFMKTEKMNRELRQAFLLKEKDLFFWGSKNRMYFPAIVKSEVSNLYYSFDSSSLTLMRGTEALKKILDDLEEEKKKKEVTQDGKIGGKEESKERRFPQMVSYLSGVSNIKFSYLGFDVKKNKSVWKDEWREENLPLAVKTEITLKDETQTIVTFIPCS